MAIQLYKQSGWIDTIKGFESFGITPEIRAQGTISKGYSSDSHPVSLDYFLVHREPEPLKSTKTLQALLLVYGMRQEELKTLHVSIPSPDLCFKTGRFKYGKKSGVLCSSDDNMTGRPLMDLKVSQTITLHQGAEQQCQKCPFNQDGSCKETVLVLFTILAPTDEQPDPFGMMLFKMTLPRTARNPFFGDYALAMARAHSTVLRYGLDLQHFPQSMIPFTVSLVLRSGQYYDDKRQTQVKTQYYVPQLNLNYERLCVRLSQVVEQFVGHQLNERPQKALVEWEPAGPDIGDGDNMPGVVETPELAELRQKVEQKNFQLLQWYEFLEKLFAYYGKHPNHVKNSVRTHLKIESGDFHECTNLAALKKYAKEQEKKLKASKDEQQDSMTDEEIDAGRERLIARYPVAKSTKLVPEYDKAVELQDWQKVRDMIEEADQ